MSYSYIKNVFPNFNSTKSLDDNVYNKLKSSNLTLNNDFQSDLNFIPSTINLEQFNEVETVASPSPSPSQGPALNQNVMTTKTPISTNYEVHNCENYIKHILSCSKCQGIMRKQLNTDNERLRNEELMELFSYILLGIFVLLFIDNIRYK
jgi:hypothetical protein